MYRSRSSFAYDILHGIQFPANMSTLLAYLSYFPPPPPILPGPPPRRSWICSSHSSASLSCFVSDDRNPSSLRPYIALNDYNQSRLIENVSHISTTTPSSNIFSSLLKYIIDLYRQNQFSFILLSILSLSLLLIIIFSLILFLYFQRHRQRSTTTNNKNKKFYYSLIPHRQKHQATGNNNEQKLERLGKDSSTAQVIRIGGIHTKNNNETEEAV